jgi:hypothetical protein
MNRRHEQCLILIGQARRVGRSAAVRYSFFTLRRDWYERRAKAVAICENASRPDCRAADRLTERAINNGADSRRGT